jgi:hypothetical protein
VRLLAHILCEDAGERARFPAFMQMEGPPTGLSSELATQELPLFPKAASTHAAISERLDRWG